MSVRSFTIYESDTCSVFQLPVLNDNYIYVLRSHREDYTAVIDPAEAEPVISFLNEKGWRLDAILNTHHHQDHIGGNRTLASRYSCPIFASAYDSYRIPDLNRKLEEGDVLDAGGLRIEVYATPGHTLGHIIYFLPEQELLFCGDTLFALGCGRLFEGSAAVMWQSLEKILRLPDSTLVCCAHEYTLANARFTEKIGHQEEGFALYVERLRMLGAQNLPTVPTRLGDEKRYNPFLKAKDPAWTERLDEPGPTPAENFASLRKAKDFSV